MRLFDDLKIKDMHLKNRIVLAPMCMVSAEDGMANDFHILHYATRAMGQMGLIIVEATAVMENGMISSKDLGLWKDEQIKPLSWITNRVKAFGSKVGIQLNHAGRRAKDTEDRVSVSSVSYGNFSEPKELTIPEIKDIIEAFRLSAKRAYLAGFDYILIHAAHGYLINSFLSPLTNQRTDIYGGSLRNRSRLLYEIIDAVREEWPLEKPLGVRISYTDYHKDGLDVRDYIEILNNIKPGLIDVIDVSSGGILKEKVEEYPAYQLRGAKMLKTHTNYFIIAGGKINDAKLADDIIRFDDADLIYFGRLALKDPYFPLKFARDLNVEIPWLRQYERGK